jgi:HSP20 family protein
MSIVRFNPWREFDDLFTRAHALSDQDHTGARWRPVADISETELDYRINLEIPAVRAKDVDVSLNDGVLRVSGTRNIERAETEKTLRVERSQGTFSRSFRLPENVDEENISAAAKEGVLYLVITKKVKDTPRRIEVAAA